MAVSLLCEPTFVSLEFACEDRGAVLSMIRELFGAATVAQYLASASVEVDGETFVYDNDDPCLIATSARGAEILEAMAGRMRDADT